MSIRLPSSTSPTVKDYFSDDGSASLALRRSQPMPLLTPD